MDQQHPDPASEGFARAAQLAAMTVSVAEAAARLRPHRAHQTAEDDAQRAAAERAIAAAHHANARLAWAPALDRAERNASSTSELLDAWSDALPYSERDPGATSAVQLTEGRLRDLHPEALQLYDMTRAEGFDRVTAMTEAQHLFRGEYGLDPIGAPIERGLADAHLARAAADIATPDLAAPPASTSTPSRRRERREAPGSLRQPSPDRTHPPCSWSSTRPTRSTSTRR